MLNKMAINTNASCDQATNDAKAIKLLAATMTFSISRYEILSRSETGTRP